jgi:hypothetical protein
VWKTIQESTQQSAISIQPTQQLGTVSTGILPSNVAKEKRSHTVENNSGCD